MGAGASSLMRLRKTLVIRAYNTRKGDETLEEQFKPYIYRKTNNKEYISLEDIKSALSLDAPWVDDLFKRCIGETITELEFNEFCLFIDTGKPPKCTSDHSSDQKPSKGRNTNITSNNKHEPPESVKRKGTTSTTTTLPTPPGGQSSSPSASSETGGIETCFLLLQKNIQDPNYYKLRLRTRVIYELLCEDIDTKSNTNTNTDALKQDKWYLDFLANGYGFETYEPDVVPTLVKAEQRIRDTGNAFETFQVDILKSPTKYTPAFSGGRPKGNDVGNWLERDPDWNATGVVESYEQRIEEFRQAYIKQTNLRLAAEERMNGMIGKKLDDQDKILGKRKLPMTPRDLIIQVGDDDNNNDNNSA
eukprot:gene8592-17721_t